MDELKEKMQSLKTTWDELYEKIKDTPDTWKQYLPYSSIVEVNEIVQTVNHWLDRLRAPSGFAPTYRLALALCGLSLNNTLVYLNKIQKSDYSNFPNFLNGLDRIISSLHSMMIFSNDIEASGNALGALGGKLSESLALLTTAQTELRSKMELIDQSQSVVDTIESQATAINLRFKEIEKIKDAINTISDETQGAVIQIEENKASIIESKEVATELLLQSKKIDEQMKKHQETLNKLVNDNREQNELISALLPKGASAGLASAFAHRTSQLNSTKWIWFGIFVSSILSMAFWSYMIIDIMKMSGSQEIWKIILERIPLVAPFVWLGWFSAVQYGNTIRVQEDYAFKEATSKAFAGYRDHMAHLANVELSEGNTAMTLLAQKTIEVLSREPLRIYQKSERDAAPTNSFISSLQGKQNNTEA